MEHIASNEMHTSLELLLNASVALFNREKTEHEVNRHSQILNRYITSLDTNSLHSLKQERLRFKIEMLELRKKQAQEVFQEHLNILQFYNTEDVRKRIDQVKQDIKELETIIIPALREILASFKSSFSMGDSLESKFDELYIDLRQVALELGISPEESLVLSPGIEGLAFTPGHNQGTSFNDDTVMDTFVDWDGGIPESANTELNVYHPFTFLPRLPSCVPLSPFTWSDGALMDFSDYFAAANTNPRSFSEPNSHISMKNPTITQENQFNKGSMKPEYIAHLYNKREQVTKLRKENEHTREVIQEVRRVQPSSYSSISLLVQLRNQVLSFETLSGARRKILGRVRAQLKFVQSPDPARREWVDAARVITDCIINCEITPILEKSEKEVRNQLVRKVEEKRPGITITANQNLTDSGLSQSSSNDLPSGSGNLVQQQVWYQTWQPVAGVRKE
ncbi:hypothetical protein F5050DRAFT_466858 [Lentinula boryana]|uniref:Uncharacterized protein n=1 Tax=Lentinula boryana TaxID=40481 RepID=A0ABQ8Q7L8_9AGAR|nr:hypothetical protein F5050DRAFT_466858 [Lentinula boryana]